VKDQRVPILLYHSISTSTNPRFKRWAVSAEMFNQHLSYLSQNRFTSITVTDLIKARTHSNVKLPERPVVLTFDDAYADFYENAFPALRRHGCVATLYVPTAYVGGTCGWLQGDGEVPRQMVTWSQLAEVSAGGIECGGHSHSHVQMDAVPVPIASAEIARCKSMLEDHIGQGVFSFAYPHGWTTANVKRLVHAAGYQSACAIKNMLSSSADDPFELARLVVTGDMDVEGLARLLHRWPSGIEIAFRDVARPVWRFVPRCRAQLKGTVSDAALRRCDQDIRCRAQVRTQGNDGEDAMGCEGLPTQPGKKKARNQVTRFEPAVMLEIEISQALRLEKPVDPKTSWDYRRALALVRLHTQPLGLIELALDQVGADADLLARSIWNALESEINSHLREDGLPEISGLDPGGLPTASAPSCLEARATFLARAPFASVVIPTHNRPHQVSALVRTVLASEYPSDKYEIIVVDNAPSTNDTEQLIEQNFGPVAQVVYAREDRPGGSHARNRGLTLAKGEIVVFADDDELVDRYWLTEMVRGFGLSNAIACVTGLVLPMESETQSQEWFEQFGGYCKGRYDHHIFNLTTHRSDHPLYPYNLGSFGSGGSMAFRRSTLGELGGFDLALGPGTPALGGEDLDAMLRVILAGHALVYTPTAIVRHPPYREYALLRNQLHGYGTGIAACLCKTLVTNPRLLPSFIGKLPKGLLFAFSAQSPRNRGKQSGFPRELTWLEHGGVLYGPVAYARSRFRLVRSASQARWSVEASRIATDAALGEAHAQG
jgi:GT2 family glycosyltransferase/peptidoglycan/xylan/chitin deacetylase (PgdA/CDA1 family)